MYLSSNITTQDITSQHKYTQYPLYFEDCLRNHQLIPKLLRPHHRLLFNKIIALSLPQKYINPSHAYLAKECGISVSTVQRTLRKLRDWGWLRWTYRHRNSNLYYVHPLFYNYHVINVFAPYFEALVYWQNDEELIPSEKKLLERRSFQIDRPFKVSYLFIIKSSNQSSVYLPSLVNQLSLVKTREAAALKTDKTDDGRIDRKEIMERSREQMKHFGLQDTQIEELVTGYPLDTIKHAITRYKTVKDVKVPFNYFKAICEKHRFEAVQKKSSPSVNPATPPPPLHTSPQPKPEKHECKVGSKLLMMDDDEHHRLMTVGWEELTMTEKQDLWELRKREYQECGNSPLLKKLEARIPSFSEPKSPQQVQMMANLLPVPDHILEDWAQKVANDSTFMSRFDNNPVGLHLLQEYIKRRKTATIFPAKVEMPPVSLEDTNEWEEVTPQSPETMSIFN